MDPNKWAHYLVSKTGSKYAIYLDGQLLSTESSSSQIPSGITGELSIGRSEGNSLNGKLDDIRIYNRALSEVEVAALYELESVSGSTFPEGYFFIETFDDLELGPNVDEEHAKDKAWTKTGPDGWVINRSGVPGNSADHVGYLPDDDGDGYPDNDGVSVWAGWSFADKDWWVQAEDQSRSTFNPPAAYSPKWIWRDLSSTGYKRADRDAPEETIYFRKNFDLSEIPDNATAVLTCDNHFKLFLNGTLVAEEANWGNTVSVDLAPYMQIGKNILAVEASNWGGTAGFIFSGQWGKKPLLSDDSWQVSTEEESGWQNLEFNADNWAKAQELGSMGMNPWEYRFNANAFNLRNIIAVADPDEWDDKDHAPTQENGWYKTWMSTPDIDISGRTSDKIFMSFNSSWRPYFEEASNQAVYINLSYDGGDPVQILNWVSDPDSEKYHGDNQNEFIVLPLTPPEGARKVKFSFGMREAGNDWWWAIDNVKVYSPPSYTEPYQIVEGSFTWHEAKADAEARGGHLATITSQAEQNAITNILVKDYGRSRIW
ncbi:MAG: hypothetical protein OSA95_13990, partial [Opitutales bacterium]|nr:hypothetical protein [Opitutales bacterium]